MGDTTTLREFPPLRSAWARRGHQAVVTISGRNARRALHGVCHPQTGEMVRVVTDRSRGADVAQVIAALGAVRPGIPKLLIWDNAPPHHTHVVRDAAREAGIEIAWLPFRSPELNPCEDLWRRLKAVIAANRCYTTVDELAHRALDWLDHLSADDVLRYTGLSSSKFDWLLT